jgi:hypothetical protein
MDARHSVLGRFGWKTSHDLEDSAMRFVDLETPVNARSVTKAVLSIAAVGLVLGVASPRSLAQTSPGDARTGVAKPQAVIIPSADDSPAPVVATKPSAAIPVASGETAYGPYVPYRGGATPAAATGAASSKAYDPDAHIAGDAPAGLVRRDDSAGKIDPDAGIVSHVPWLPNEIPDGALLKVKLLESISTETTRPHSPFTAEVTEAVIGDGRVYIPAGSVLKGRVTWAHGGSRISGGATIHLETRTMTLPDGIEYPVHARVIDTDSWNNTKVNSEGTILRKDHAKGTAAAVGLATGSGAAAGAMIGGVPGALIGAGVGAGVSAVVWLKQDREAVLPKDLGLVFCFTSPMSVTPEKAGIPGKGTPGGE